jgi:hypothetical protein
MTPIGKLGWVCLAALSLGCDPEPCTHQEIYVACMQRILLQPPSTELGWAAANDGCYIAADRQAGERLRLLAFTGCRR